jgi:hypothetical protein
MARITQYQRGDFVTIEVLFEKRSLHTTTYIAEDPANPKVTISHAARAYTPVNAQDLTGDSGTGYYSYKWQTGSDDPLGVYKVVITGADGDYTLVQGGWEFKLVA